MTASEPAQYKAIALTGGPCGGKTSSLAILSEMFENCGWKVFRVPEAATILLSGGVVWAELDSEQSYSFQKSILHCMLSIEDAYRDLAKMHAAKGVKSIVICDRGAMDCSAYVDREIWLNILKDLNLDELDVRDKRYDCIVHLVTAADGAEDFYQLENNSTRSEGVELARKLDSLIQNAWTGHPYMDIIDNSTDFAGKCNRVVESVLNRLGATDKRFGNGIRKYKFLVENYSHDIAFPVPHKDFIVEHTYTFNHKGDDTQIRIRRREDPESGSVHYNMTMRHREVNGQRVETRRNLLPREYEALKAQSDPSRVPIYKKRRCFNWQNRYFQLDVFESPRKGLVLLEAYLESKQFQNQLLPPWWKLTEVTDDKSYSMYEMAFIDGVLTKN